MEYTTKIITYPDGCNVIAHHPILTKEEYDRRHKELEKATARFLRHVEEAKQKKASNT